MSMEPNQIPHPGPYDPKAPPSYGPGVKEPQETLQIRPRPPADQSSALWPTLTKVGSDYKLAMNLGHVDARKHVGDAAVPIEITDIPGQPDPIADALTVASGDKIYCKITEDDEGVATAAAIEKDTDWPESTAPTLIGGDEVTGANGTRYIRLCEIVTVGGLVKVKVWHTGNIAHFQPELAENTAAPSEEGFGARVLKVWNVLTGQWMFRMLSKGFGQLSITENADDIVIRGTKKDSDVTVYYGETASEEPFLGFRDGLETTGEEVEGDEDPAVDPAEKNIYIPTVVAWDDEDAQIQVQDISAGDTTVYEVRGNANDATFSISVNGGTPETLLTCKDGLVPDESKNIDITIPEGDGMPPGEDPGDMLYWDGEAWVLLPTPGAPGSGNRWVLHHSGTAPSWVEYDEVVVNICVSGTPTEYTILGIPTGL
jgi:hypothetical protein